MEVLLLQNNMYLNFNNEKKYFNRKNLNLS